MQKESAKTVVGQIISQANDVSGQKYVVRYNGKPTVTRQNLYEHHASVSQILLLLFEKFDVPEQDQLLSLKRALTHDLPEIETADIPFNTHVNYAGFSEAYDVVEESLLKNRFSKFDFRLEKGTAPWHLVKTADCLDVVLFCQQEIDLGNDKSQCILEMLEQDTKLAAEHIIELGKYYGTK
jgi:5'-deoxynucleotidase YfbR-like HD superfamily hydrolase